MFACFTRPVFLFCLVESKVHWTLRLQIAQIVCGADRKQIPAVGHPGRAAPAQVGPPGGAARERRAPA